MRFLLNSQNFLGLMELWAIQWMTLVFSNKWICFAHREKKFLWKNENKKHNRESNCVNLVITRVNLEFWSKIRSNTRSRDIRMQKHSLWSHYQCLKQTAGVKIQFQIIFWGRYYNNSSALLRISCLFGTLLMRFKSREECL